MEVLHLNLEKLPPAFTHIEGCVIKASREETRRMEERGKVVEEVDDGVVIMQQHPENPFLFKPRDRIQKALQAEVAASEKANLLHADQPNLMKVSDANLQTASAYPILTAEELQARREGNIVCDLSSPNS